MGVCHTVVSGKGGTGKTVLCAFLGAALAEAGEKILLIDGDLGMRSLDLALGTDNVILNHLADVVEGRCSFEEAAVPVPECPGVTFLPAPQTLGPESLDPEKFRSFITERKEQFDRILIDSPPGIGRGVQNAAAAADSALIVADGSRAAVRGADRVHGILEDRGLRDCRLILNRLVPEDGTDPSEISDLLGIPVLGVIPEDRELSAAAESGRPVLPEDSTAAECIRSTAARLRGGSIPLEDLKSMRKKGFFPFFRRK